MINHDVCVRDQVDSDSDSDQKDPTGGLNDEELKIEGEWNLQYQCSIKKGDKV